MGTIAEFTARGETRNRVARIALGGELDLETVPHLNEQLERFEQDGASAILLDLRDLTFIDSTGLHAFLQAKKRSQMNGHQLFLIGATAAARRVFELTGTQFLLNEREAVSVLDHFTGSRSGRASQSGPTNGDAGV